MAFPSFAGTARWCAALSQGKGGAGAGGGRGGGQGGGAGGVGGISYGSCLHTNAMMTDH